MTLPRRYPAAAWEPVSYIGEAGPEDAVSLGWIEHVVVGDGDPWGTFQRAVAPGRRFSHLWFAKDGRVTQYQYLDRACWAQAAGNGHYWACETEGTPDEPLTGPQLDALAAFHVWSGTPDLVADAPGQKGIGTHQMGGPAWGGHVCPGATRAAQRPEIIARARALRGGDMPISDAEFQRFADIIKANNPALAVEVETRFQVHDASAPGGLETKTTAIGDIQAAVKAIQAALAGGAPAPASSGAFTAAQLEAVKAAVGAVVGPAVAAATAAELARWHLTRS